jgi:hypothetical protein
VLLFSVTGTLATASGPSPQQNIATTPTSASSTTSPAITSNDSSPNKNSNSPDTNGHLSPGVIAGIVVGVAAACLLGLLGIFLYKKKNNGRISIGGWGLCNIAGRSSSRRSDDSEERSASQNEQTPDTYYSQTIHVNRPKKDSYPAIALLDSGANGNYVTRDWLTNAEIEPDQVKLLVGKPRIITVDNKSLKIEGYITLNWSGSNDWKISTSSFGVLAESSWDIIIGKELNMKEKSIQRNPDAMVLRQNWRPCKSKFQLCACQSFTY